MICDSEMQSVSKAWRIYETCYLCDSGKSNVLITISDLDFPSKSLFIAKKDMYDLNVIL